MAAEHRAEPEARDESSAGQQSGEARTEPGGGAAPGDGRDTLLVLPVRGLVMFPGLVLPVAVETARGREAVQEAVRSEREVGVLLLRERGDGGDEEPGPDELYRVGTIVNVLRFLRTADGDHAVCQGQQRFRVLEFAQQTPYLAARIQRIEEPRDEGREVEARALGLKQQTLEALELMPRAPNELVSAVREVAAPGQLADIVATITDAKPSEKQQVLETIALPERLDKAAQLLNERLEVLKLSREMAEQTKTTLDKEQREFLLRRQLRQIQEELGEADGKGLEDLRAAIEEAGMPEEVLAEAKRELARLERLPEAAAEYGMARTHLELLAELPWAKGSLDEIDLPRAREVLDEDHHDLDKIKKRILEHLAVGKLNPEGKSPVLCFVGPPGVGKTSLGQSIARATGREFVRASLGGVHDESEIRGHRRTYVGALPGRIVQGIRRAGVRNPVFMLDELDKLGRSLQGDPSSALLEVLDPEQNDSFRDNYLGVPFDLSKVMFIGTANVIDAVPGPLRDRCEVIELPGYTEQDKLAIARRYLLERQLERAGLAAEQCAITDDAIRKMIARYTREAGCRNLERTIGAVCRHAAMRIAEDREARLHVDADDLAGILGPEKFERELAQRTSVPGAATGLAWTPAGGEVLFIEASRMKGKGELILTGQLGDVMRESAQAALSLVRSKLGDLELEPDALDDTDIHIHVPAGAIPKDGPSAGVAMYVALVSLVTGRTARSNVAMTGEISLRGLVLPVGGIKEKALGAESAGIEVVLLPERNRKDWDDIPEEVRDRLDFVWLETVQDAVEAAVEQPEPSGVRG